MPDDFQKQLEGRTNKPAKEQGTLEVYKNSRWYRLKQKIRWLTPKKKIMYFLILPLLAVIAGTFLFITIAAPGAGNPFMWLKLGTGSLDGQTLRCGQTYNIDIMANADGKTPGVLVAGAYLYYDPTYITVNSINTDGSYFDIGAAGPPLQFIDQTKSLVTVIRGKTSAIMDSSDHLLATLNITVKAEAKGSSVIRFYRTDPKSIFILGDGTTTVEADYKNNYTSNQDGVYNLTIDCMEIPEGGVGFFFDKSQQAVDCGETFPVKLMIKGNLDDVTSWSLGVKGNPVGGLTIDGLNTKPFSGGALSGIEAELATLSIKAEKAGTQKLYFYDVKDVKAEGIEADKIKASQGIYVVNQLAIELCETWEVRAEVTESKTTPGTYTLYLDWCTDPAAKCKIEDPTGAPSRFITIDNNTVQSKHLYSKIDLGNNKETDFKITCTLDDCHTAWVYESKVSLADSKNLIISNGPAADPVGATTATISWETIGGALENGLSRSRVFYKIKGADTWEPSVGDDKNLTSAHEVKLTGLLGNTEYEYYAMSAIEGICVVGISNPKCVGSAKRSFKTKDIDEEPDSNLILKVNRDRVCDEWLYCNAGVEVTDAKTNKKETMCFSTGLCEEMDSDGRCVSIVDEKKVTDMTFATPAETAKIKNMSGYAKVGLDWGKRCLETGESCTVSVVGSCECVAAKIDGYKSYSVMNEVGIPVQIPNNSFEEGTVRPWQVENDSKIEVVTTERTNKALKITPKVADETQWSGATIKSVASGVYENGTYVISFRAKTSKLKGQDIVVELNNNNEKNKYVKLESKDGAVLTLTNYWQEYILTTEEKINKSDEPMDLLVVQNKDTNIKKATNDPFYIDDILMKAVLDVGGDKDYAARTCRMYPSTNAPACDYYDSQSNKEYRGWKGYCVEKDPAYDSYDYPMCLQWWPVDIIQGEANAFSQEAVVGYTGRKPLYYCLEAAGNAPYVGKKTVNVLEGGVRTVKDKNTKIENDITVTLKDHENDDFKNREKYAIDGLKIFFQFSRPGGELKDNVYEVYLNRDSDWRGSKTLVIGPGAEITIEFEYNDSTAINLIMRANGESGGTLGVVQVQFYYREPCLKIAQVVTMDGESVPWTDRVNSQFISSENWIGYERNQDYAPFGAAVVPEPAYDPAEWVSQDPLYIEPPNTNLGFQKPYQVRAGSPYGTKIVSLFPRGEYSELRVEGICSKGDEWKEDDPRDEIYCHSNNNTINFDCEYTKCRVVFPDKNCRDLGLDVLCSVYIETTSGSFSKPEFGPATCVSGSNVGKTCNSGQDCGYDYESGLTGRCVGFSLPREYKDWGEFNTFFSEANHKGVDNLSQLFAKSYGVWEWATITNKYIKIDEDWDITASGTDKGVDPIIPDIFVNSTEVGQVDIWKQGPVILKFTSWVDKNQLPLVAYSVDWGDTVVSAESGLRIAGRTLDNPHVLVHYYKYDENCTNHVDVSQRNPVAYCKFNPKITIEDNWGKKKSREFGEGLKDKDGKPITGVEIRVYAEEPPAQSAKLKVDETELTYYQGKFGAKDYKLPFDQSFTIKNNVLTGNNLNWKIENFQAGGIFDKNSSSYLNYNLSPGFGSTGTLRPGESTTVSLNIASAYNLEGAFPGEAAEDIVITADDGQRKVVKVTVKTAPGFLVFDDDDNYAPLTINLTAKKPAMADSIKIWLSSSQAGGLGWHENHSSSWISLEEMTKDSLKIRAHSANLAPGTYTDTIVFTADSYRDNYGAEKHEVKINFTVTE